MAWKIERWFVEVYRREEDLNERYGSLSARELAIVACATLDVALVDLLARRLIDDEAEVTGLLGADEDGSAPVGSFGARIQLAYLLGLISKGAATALRAIKKLRNSMAHRVNVNILDPKAQGALEALRAGMPGEEDDPSIAKKLKTLADLSRTDEMAARVLVILTFSALNDVLYEIAPNVERVREAEVE